MDSIWSAIRLMKPNCYMASIDLKNAYYSVPIHPEHQKYLKFNWKGKQYRFVCFPNGLAICPRKFTKLLKPVYSQLRKNGHISVVFIDDSWLTSDTYAACVDNIRDTVTLLSETITFLGFLLNSLLMQISLTADKAQKVKQMCQELLANPRPSIRDVARALGTFTASLPGVMYGQLHYRWLEIDKTDALKLNKGNLDKLMTLSPDAIHDLNWWYTSIPSAHNPISHGETQVCITTDASLTAWGCSLDDVNADENWTPIQAEHHINYLEMLAVFFALKLFSSQISGKHVKVLIDNTTAVAGINQLAAHIPGIENITADRESRILTLWHALLAYPKVVAFASSSDANPPSTQQARPVALPFIGALLSERGISSQASVIIQHSWRTGTKKQYATHLNRWRQYCGARGIDPISASVENGINFLSELYTQELSYSAINTARSALSTIILVPGGTTFGNHPLVTRFVKGVFVSRPALPRYTELWDISLMFNYLRTLHPVEELNLKELTLKTVMLLAILSGQRFIWTLHDLSITSMERQENKYIFYVNQLLKTSKPGKHWGRQEFTAYPSDPRLCIVSCLNQYLKKTESIRKNSVQLLLSYQKPHHSVSCDTFARCLKSVMKEAGLNIDIYSAHSTRAASTSAAKAMNIPIQTIINAAAWTNEQTFQKFYCKPIASSSTFGENLVMAFSKTYI
ncbi:Transposon Ty3-G Gag-Pol poly [Paramuricea clavata]|uniref:Transposon Ty3-G Gag-Pol poly n=1 Tax=Paramuricea clavata TaxID=317549 RepID=A0A6S7JM47_PARCT|nr:Transposon Ty3-G Gag-Pol poly [Paramuricea clavata]